MQRQFKHIRTGNIYTQGKYNSNNVYFKGNIISLDIAENDLGWEEIKNDEYLITSFINKENEEYVDLHDNGLYCCKNFTSYKGVGVSTKESCLNKNFLTIYSVKDLKGNEWKIGDKVTDTVSGGDFTIKEFSLKDSRCFTCGVNINYIKRQPDFSFTTEDKVVITDPEQLVWDISRINWDYIDQTPVKYFKNGNLGNDRRAFADKKNAQNYILMKRPTLSLEEISYYCTTMMQKDTNTGTWSNNYTKIDVEKLQKLVKMKLGYDN